MKEKLRLIFKNNWPEVTLAPPMVVGFAYFIYGEAYFASWQNFLKMTIPWQLVAICMGISSEWVRRISEQRFKRMDQTGQRIFTHQFSGFIFMSIFANLAWFGLKKLPFPEIHPPDERYYPTMLLAVTITLCMLTAYEAFIYFKKWKEAISEAEQLEKLTLESQFRSLQSQLNPHFLFNSFNVLSSLIAENPRRAEDFVDELSNVYRYLLRSNEQELASVGEELRFIRSYFHLLETRHDTGIALKINVQKENFDKKLPALALQILLENAVKHNEISPEKPLQVEIFDGKSAEQTCLIVRNNLQRKATRPHSNNVGLDNLRQRYELLGMTGFEVQNDGRYFTVTLPIV